MLVYVSDPLEEDVTIAGPISPKLKIASSGTDSDFDVKLIDVYPENYPDSKEAAAEQAHYGCAAAAHGRLSAVAARRAIPRQVPQQLGEARAADAGEETDINFTMPDLFHTFRRGHRIMVQVQSSWFPLTDRNPQTFTDIPNATPEQFQKATEQVFHQKDAASGVEVLVMPRD